MQLPIVEHVSSSREIRPIEWKPRRPAGRREESALELFSAISFLATLVSGFAVGGRLLWLARRTRQAPELFLGASVSALALASVLEVAALEWARAGGGHGAWGVEVVALGLHSLSSGALAVGLVRIFHPGRAAARLACAALLALLVASWIAIVAPGQHTSLSTFSPWFHVQVAARGAAFAWGAVAAGAYHRQLRRQRALGLVDAFTAHRFALWSRALAASAAILLVALVTNTLAGVLVFDHAGALLAVSGLGLLAAPSLWYAFLPPDRYRRRIQERAVGSL
jgi:hypothetical protein